MSTVCVFGSSSEAIDRRYLDAAYSLGAAICRRGEGMIFGAGKYGIMGAAARGYISEGGVPTGVSPYFFRERNVLLEECNLVFTDSMRERKAYMEDNSDAFVICAGGIGTLQAQKADRYLQPSGLLRRADRAHGERYPRQISL